MKGTNSLSHIKSLVLVAGVSGAGKSTAIDFLSDLGFYKIDNLPVGLLKDFLELSRRSPEKFSHTALLLDIESRQKLEQLLSILKSFGPRPKNLQIVFLDCDDQSIVRRYSETRRPHPNFDPTRDQTLQDSIKRERNRLISLKEIASLVVDTSNQSIHELKRKLKEFVDGLPGMQSKSMRINFLSFGFKHGIPLDCDLIVDLRFLPNPHFVDDLREKTGLDKQVAKYVLKSKDAQQFLKKYAELLKFLIPRYIDEGKAYLNIGVGCTGGKHRSVVMAQELSRSFKNSSWLISVKHRDLAK